MVDKDLRRFILNAVGLAMGIATLVLNTIKAVEIRSIINLLSMGVICLAINGLENKEKN